MTAHDGRVACLRERLREEELEALLVTCGANVTYLTGFRGDDSWLVLTQEGQWFLTDGRYSEQAAAEAPGWELVQRKETLVKTLAELFPKVGAKQLAFEAPHFSHASYLRLAEAVDGAQLVPREDLVEKLREIKDETEIEQIREAVKLAEAAFIEVRDQLAAGRTESEVAASLDYAMRRRGARRASFDVIVAARERSSLPHAQPSDAVIGQGDAVLFDWGAERGLYCSDTTRVVFLAPPDGQWRAVYSVVLEAQQKAIAAIRPGARSKEVDAAARHHIAEAGHGEHFSHGLGHGLGLRVHEAPTLNQYAETELAAGMVVTVEPGIYLPGWGGVRIEDLVCVREDGAEVLTTLPKDLDAAILS